MSEAKAAKFKVGDRVTVDFSDHWRGGGVIKSYSGGFFQVEMNDGKRGGFSEESLTLAMPEKTDFTAVNVGDRVRPTGYDEVHEFFMRKRFHDGSIGSVFCSYDGDENWTLEILERAKPELPIKPGYYSAHDKLANSDFVVRVTEGGEIQFPQGSKWDKLGDPERFAPFTRLVSVESND